jgi:hypothetical protein
VSYVITYCAAIVANLAWAQLSMVSQDCPENIVIEKLALPAPVLIKPTAKEVPKIIPKPKCRKGQRVWRTLKNGHRKYRIRRKC